MPVELLYRILFAEEKSSGLESGVGSLNKKKKKKTEADCTEFCLLRNIFELLNVAIAATHVLLSKQYRKNSQR